MRSRAIASIVERMRSSVAGRKPTQRHQERSRVQLVGVEGLRVGLALLAPAALEHRLADAVALGRPFVDLRAVLAEHAARA